MQLISPTMYVAKGLFCIRCTREEITNIKSNIAESFGAREKYTGERSSDWESPAPASAIQGENRIRRKIGEVFWARLVVMWSLHAEALETEIRSARQEICIIQPVLWAPCFTSSSIVHLYKYSFRFHGCNVGLWDYRPWFASVLPRICNWCRMRSLYLPCSVASEAFVPKQLMGRKHLLGNKCHLLNPRGRHVRFTRSEAGLNS